MNNWMEIQTVARDRQAEIEKQTWRRNRSSYEGYTIHTESALVRAARRLLGALTGGKRRQPAPRARRPVQRKAGAPQTAAGEAIIF
jgi:hypothetical protein